MDIAARRILVILLVGLLGACSLRGAMNAMTSPEDRAFAQAMVDSLRTGNETWLRQQFHPDLWEESGKQLGGVPAMFPAEPGTTELVAYHFESTNLGAAAERTQEFTLVTDGGGRWAVTRFRTHSSGGGPRKITQWSVVPHTTEPSELTMLKAMDRAVPWMWAGAGFVLLVIAGIVVLIVRKNRRRRRDPLMGQPPGTP